MFTQQLARLGTNKECNNQQRRSSFATNSAGDRLDFEWFE